MSSSEVGPSRIPLPDPKRGDNIRNALIRYTLAHEQGEKTYDHLVKTFLQVESYDDVLQPQPEELRFAIKNDILHTFFGEIWGTDSPPGLSDKPSVTEVGNAIRNNAEYRIARSKRHAEKETLLQQGDVLYSSVRQGLKLGLYDQSKVTQGSCGQRRTLIEKRDDYRFGVEMTFKIIFNYPMRTPTQRTQIFKRIVRTYVAPSGWAWFRYTGLQNSFGDDETIHKAVEDTILTFSRGLEVRRVSRRITQDRSPSVEEAETPEAMSEHSEYWENE